LDKIEAPTLDDIEELNRLCYGDIVYKKLWNKYKFAGLLSKVVSTKKIQYDFVNTVYLLVIDRLLNPRSKLACFQRQDSYLNMSDVKLQHLYRCLDMLAEANVAIETLIFDRQKDLFHASVVVVFYDVTTFLSKRTAMITK
jgi:hypothetical protein